MKNKNQLNKLDIVRWILVFPAAITGLLIYREFSSWLSKIYLLNFHGDGNSYFTVYIDCFFIPAIVLISGYLISPKFKFRSTLILISFFILTTIYALFNNEYVGHTFNPFLIVYFVTVSLGLFVIYKIDKK